MCRFPFVKPVSLSRRLSRSEGGDAVRGRSVFRIVPPQAELTLSDLESQFGIRLRIEAANRTAMAESYAALRRQYADQSRHAQQQFADPRIKQPACAALFHLAIESVKVSRLVYDALQEADRVLCNGDAWIVSPEVVERAVDWNRRLLVRLSGQLHLLDMADEVILPLKKLFDQLEGSRHASALGWRSIARHLLSQTDGPRVAADLIPMPGFSVGIYLSQAGHAAHGAAFGRGLETLFALAPALAARDFDSLAVDVLSIAALCQDCGLLLLERPRTSVQQSLAAAEAAQKHAALGAGVVGGIGELAAELPPLVAEHHRRFAGFGHVPDFNVGLQRTGSRLLATTVRFLELVAEPAADASGRMPGASLYPAALRLNHEALRGEWDTKIAGELLSRLGFIIQYETVGGLANERIQQADRRLDAADPHVPDPNFLFPEAAREIIHVRSFRG
jgi:hypothetical protein